MRQSEAEARTDVLPDSQERPVECRHGDTYLFHEQASRNSSLVQADKVSRLFQIRTST